MNCGGDGVTDKMVVWYVDGADQQNASKLSKFPGFVKKRSAPKEYVFIDDENKQANVIMALNGIEIE